VVKLIGRVVPIVITKYTTSVLHPETSALLLRLGDTDMGRNELPGLLLALGFSVRIIDESTVPHRSRSTAPARRRQRRLV
jgi:hypothetical protein